METIENIKANHYHLGKKIERVRRLRGMTQTELGQLLGITKQAVSKMEQTEKIDDERLEKIASALAFFLNVYCPDLHADGYDF